jgi:hypothetical protein
MWQEPVSFVDSATPPLPPANALVTVFENGEIRRRWTFDEVRARAEAVLL